MFLPTEAFKEEIEGYKGEPTFRIGRKVPHEAVNLAFYFNPTATDAERVLCAEAPRNTIDHRIEVKYLYKYGCPDNDNSKFKYFDPYYYYEDEEGYTGYLPLIEVTWYEHKHVETKYVEQVKTFITDKKNNVENCIYYAENSAGGVIEDPDPSKIDPNGVYCGYLFLNSATWEVKTVNTEIVKQSKEMPIRSYEIEPQQYMPDRYSKNAVSDSDLNMMMKAPTTNGDSPWPVSLWVYEDGVYDNKEKFGYPVIEGNPFNGYVTNPANPLKFKMLEKEPLSWEETGYMDEDAGDSGTLIYGPIFLSEYEEEDDLIPDKATFSTAEELDEFIDLARRFSIDKDNKHYIEGGSGKDDLHDDATELWQILLRYEAGYESADNIVIRLKQRKQVQGIVTDDEGNVYDNGKSLTMASYFMEYTKPSGGTGKGGAWAVYCNFEGTLYQITEEIKQTPATWEATCIYEGQVDKRWNTYDGMAMYKGAVTQGEGVGNVNPELSPDILLYPDDDGYLRRILTSTENDGEGNIIEVTKNLYEIEAEHFYITNVFKDGTACFYKHDLKYQIHDYRGPDNNGCYSGDAVAVYTSNMRSLPENHVYSLRLKAVSKEKETYIIDREVRERETAAKYNVSLYTNFVSKTTDTYMACYHAFTEETDRKDEEVYNYPFFYKNVDYSVESVDKYERSSKIKITEPDIITDTRAWITFEYIIKVCRKTGTGTVFATHRRSARILNKEYAVSSEHKLFEGRAMIISPKINGNYQTPLDLVLDDERNTDNAPVLASNSDDFVFYGEIIRDTLPSGFIGAVNLKVNADGTGVITAETTMDTGFYNTDTKTWTDKLIIDNPYLVENGKIYAGYMVKCLDVRNIAVRPPREKGLLDSWYPMLRFGHYSQVQDQYGAHTKICYTMPEYDDQDYSSIYGIPYIDVKKEKTEILNPHMIKTSKYPLLVYDAAGSVANSFIYGDRIYRVFLKQCTWKEAKAYCESIGGTLAMPKTKEQNENIINIAKAYNINGLWLGGTDEGHEGTWTWLDETPIEYANWNTGEPNNMGGNEHYLETYTSGDTAGKWNDLADDNISGISGFICEFDKFAATKIYRYKEDDVLYPLKVINVSFSEGIIMVEEALSENDVILADYTYLEEYYQYRGFYRNEKDFARIDLNPNIYHTYSDMTYEPSELKPSKNLFNKTLYFYLRPTIRIRGEDVEDRDVIIDSSDSGILEKLYNTSDLLVFEGTSSVTKYSGADKESQWGNVDGTIKSLTNVTQFQTFLTAEKYKKYTHTFNISSSDTDDDIIAGIVAAVDDGEGGYHTLSVICCPNNSQAGYLNLPDGNTQFALIYDYCQGDRMKVLAVDSTFTTTGLWNSYPGGMNIKIDKTSDGYVKIYRSSLLSAESDEIGTEPVISLSLASILEQTGTDFTEGNVGYGNYSQIGATFKSIKLEVVSENTSTHIEWDTEHPLVKNEETLYHTIDKYMPESELDIYIGSVYIRQNTSLYSTILIDTRTRGGGVIESMKDALRRKLEPESDYYLDIGCYDGTPYQENAVIIVRLDNRILKEYGGTFTQGDIELKVKKFLGLGVYPIIEYVDSYSKYEMPQYNLEISDTYSNIMDITLDFELECIKI